jgi:hypothetical protein
MEGLAGMRTTRALATSSAPSYGHENKRQPEQCSARKAPEKNPKHSYRSDGTHEEAHAELAAPASDAQCPNAQGSSRYAQHRERHGTSGAMGLVRERRANE